MSIDQLPRTYTIRPGWTAAFLLSAGFALAGNLLPLWLTDDIPVWMSLTVTLPLAGFLFWIIYATGRLATTADLTGIQIRRYFRNTRITWENIQDMKVVVGPGAFIQDNSPAAITCVYDRSGRTLILPYLDDNHVDVEHEFQLLHGIWQELRGENWVKDAETTANINHRLIRDDALLWGAACSLMAVVPLVLLGLIPRFLDFPGWLGHWQGPFIVMGLGLPVVFALSARHSYRKNLRGV